MNKHQLSRRHFNTLCAAVGSLLPTGSGIASVLAVDALPRTVKLPNGASIPAIGQGSARLGQGRRPEAAEEEALRTGISLGMTLIDTSGDYGNGRSEKLIGRAIAGQRYDMADAEAICEAVTRANMRFDMLSTVGNRPHRRF